MKNITLVGILVALFMCLTTGMVQADLTTIGTATYSGNEYNLIYEDDNIDGGLVWLDYTRSLAIWDTHVHWSQSLGGSLTVNLNAGVSTDIDWSTGWRLPYTQGHINGNDFFPGNEMEHLYYISLGNSGSLVNTHDFDNLYSLDYWSEHTAGNYDAWAFHMGSGILHTSNRNDAHYGMAVHVGEVSISVVPEPISSTLFIVGGATLGFRRFRKKIKN